jgi:hypothetical protein
LTIYQFINNGDKYIEQPKLPLLGDTECALFDLPEFKNNESTSWKIFTQSFSQTHIMEEKNSSGIWFTDFEDTNKQTDISLKCSNHYTNLPNIQGVQNHRKIVAVRNNFPLLQNFSYNHIVVFETDSEENPHLINLYQTNPTGSNKPTMSEYTFFLIIKYIIKDCFERFEKNEVDEAYFPAFPSYRSIGDVENENLFNEIEVHTLPLGAGSIEVNRYACWIISPIPINILCTKVKGKNQYFWERERMEFDKMKEKYPTAYNTLNLFIGNTNERLYQLIKETKNNSQKETEKKIYDTTDKNLSKFAEDLYEFCKKYSM